MKISSDGLRLIKSFEGYHRTLPNGDCIAYKCPAGVWTIGYGCTEGIKEGMVWAKDEAEARLLNEIVKFEAGVNRLVTAEINQNQFDALVSFAYNCGLGALERSKILKATNAGNFSKAAASFAAWNKGGGKVLPGLVQRRARESVLYMKPMEAPSEPFMPQKVAKSVEVPRGAVAASTATVGATAATVAPTLPAPPDLAALSQYRAFGEQLSDLGSWALNNWWLTAGLVVWMGFAWGLRFVRAE